MSKRAVGFCTNVECDEFHKSIFLLNQTEHYFCVKCKKDGEVEPEISVKSNNCSVFREVRIEYNFNPDERRYVELAIVRDEDINLVGANVLNIKSPLIKTSKRALTLAEKILAQLQYIEIRDGEIPSTMETIIDLSKDKKELLRDLEELEYRIFYAAQKRRKNDITKKSGF